MIGIKKFINEIVNVYARGQKNFGSDTVLSESPNFMDFWLSSFNTTDELGSFFLPTTIIGRPTDGSNWLLTGNDISEGTADRVSGTKAKNHYNFKSKFETRRENQVDHNFGRQNNPVSQSTLDSPHIGTNTTNRTMSLSDLIPVRTKTPDPTPLTRPTEFPEKNGKAHILGDPDPDPSLSDSSSKKYNLSNDSNSSKSKKRKRDKKGNCRKDQKDDLSDPS